jgi:uncharacterized protein (DUF2132 family)
MLIDNETRLVISYIIKKYYIIVHQYFVLMNDSIIIRQLDNVNNIIQVGLNAITHIFKINLFFYKNVDVAFYYSQKAYYCYLEYIEQINIKCITDDLNIKDAILFIYNKTLSREDITNFNVQEASRLENGDISENGLLHIENFEVVEGVFPIINDVVYYVSNFDNSNLTLINRVNICEKYLLNYLNFFVSNTHNINTNKLFEYLKILNEKKDYSYDTYCLFLQELLTYISNAKNINKQINEMFFLEYFNDNNAKLTECSKNEMKVLINHFFITTARQ